MDPGATAGRTVSLTWLGHASVVLDIEGVRLVTDPLLRRHAWPLRRRDARPATSAWRGSDAVLLSHLHHDHAELRSLRLLPGVPVLTAIDNARWLRRHGLAGVGLRDEWVPVARGVAVRLAPARHRSRPMPHRPNTANGHLVRGSRQTVWVAGDTELFPELARIPGLAGGSVDVAVVPIGGWGPRLSAGHLDPVQAATACRVVGARAALPVHWGTLHPPLVRQRPRGWMDRPGEEFVAALSRAAPGCRPLLLGPGETATYSPDGPGWPSRRCEDGAGDQPGISSA